jgi:hypothetical protein
MNEQRATGLRIHVRETEERLPGVDGIQYEAASPRDLDDEPDLFVGGYPVCRTLESILHDERCGAR